MRERLQRAFDRFIDVADSSEDDIAKLIQELEIDIAIDLMGHTRNGRPGIFARRPAPVQVSYLGYLGTMGADYIDYVIADAVALPSDQQSYYTEKIVHLPDCFLVNDDGLAIAPQTPTREEVGLPDEGFVFCSFNNSYKLTPAIFDLWMRLLRAVDGSVLWLAKANPDMAINLRREAQLPASTRTASCSRRTFRSPSTWRDSAWPICFSTRRRTMPEPRQRPRSGRSAIADRARLDICRPHGGEHAARSRAARTRCRIAFGLRGTGAQNRHRPGI